METPLVSIILPLFNSEKYLTETIDSIVNQTYTNWELIITDDFSTDKGYDLAKFHSERDKRIFLYKLNKNSGAGFARNNSIKYSKGRFIAFCDSDDQWKPNKLEIQVSFMTKTSHIDPSLMTSKKKSCCASVISSLTLLEIDLQSRLCFFWLFYPSSM